MGYRAYLGCIYNTKKAFGFAESFFVKFKILIL